jgi:hypothetical protein
MSSTLTRTKAKRRTLAAQAAAAVLLVAGIALGVTGLPEQSLPSTASVDPVNNTNAPQRNPNPGSAATPTRARVEVGSLAERLSMVDNAPDLPQEIIVATTKDPDPEPTQSGENGEIAKRLRFIGYVAEGARHAAFVRLDGVQRIVREGATIQSDDEYLSELTIKTIRPKFIIASDENGQARVMLGSRSGQSITMANGNEITPAVTEDKTTPEYDERILGDPDRVPQRELDRRRRTMDRALRGEQSRNEAARLREPPVRASANLRDAPNRTRNADD